jgi:hypothetical protein
MKYFILVLWLLKYSTPDAFGQHAPCLNDSCCRKILFTYYDKSRSEKSNVFADPVAPITISRDRDGILLKYVEHTLKGRMPGGTKELRPIEQNLYYSLQRKMRISTEGLVKQVSGTDTLFHSYSCRYGMGNDSAVTVMGTDRLHTYRPDDLLLYDRPNGKIIERIRETGFVLKGSMECSLYTLYGDSGMETTEYKLVQYKGKYFWAKSTWMKTVYLRPGVKKWSQEQYMISWMIES